ncbi:glycosyltransferase family 39 protein [Tropicimonas sp. S265A]|uniref:glycosyltransferase family 39 protein n=1 Tax=Tropicimonas sp. S265A TaxID=3415134 RepID=UPI003C7BDE5C
MRLPSLPVLLLIALVLRGIWAFLIPVDPVSDGLAYQTFATNIADHGVYGFTPDEPGAYWAVGPAAIYAAAYMVFGTGSGLGVVVVNLISSLLAVWGLYDLGRRWFGETEGRLAALLFALWPMAIQFTTVLASELHFIALTCLALMAWDRALPRDAEGRVQWTAQGIVMLALAGLAFGAATYVRPIALLIPAALGLAALLHAPRAAWIPLLKAGVATAIIFATVAPWSERNARVLEADVFMSTNFWANFWMGNHPGTNGEYQPLPPETRGLSEVERAAFMRELSLSDLRADPAGLVWRTGWKALKLHQRETIGVGWNSRQLGALVGGAGVAGLKLVSTGWWYAMLLAAAGGIVVLARRTGVWATLLSVPVWLWLYFTGVHAVIVVGDRYHMPAIPMIALLAAIGLAALAVRWTKADPVQTPQT